MRFLRDDLVLVTVADPTNVLASDDLKLTLGLNVRLAVSAATEATSVPAHCSSSPAFLIARTAVTPFMLCAGPRSMLLMRACA